MNLLENLNESLTSLRQLKMYIDSLKSYYQGLSKKEKSHLVNSFVAISDACEKPLHRKSILRRLNSKPSKKVSPTPSKPQRPRGRPALYNNDQLIWWLQTLWVCMNQVNEKSMHAQLPVWLAKNKDPNFDEETKRLILQMSPSSIERAIRDYKRDYQKRIFSATKRASFKTLHAKIPQRPLNFKINCSGYLEGDTVAHCGNTLRGVHAWTLNTVDHHSHWCEQVAILGKTAENVLTGTIELRKRYPFQVKGFHSDCGSEFINSTMYEYFQDPKHFVTQTSGRAYKKNDQARIEQRNWSHVRQVFAYDRIETGHLVEMMNDIYSNELSLLNNFFTATRKQISKTRVGAKYRRKFSQPQSPFERVMKDRSIGHVIKNQLQKQFDELDPYQLKKQLDQKLKFFNKALKNYQEKIEEIKQQPTGLETKKAA